MHEINRNHQQQDAERDVERMEPQQLRQPCAATRSREVHQPDRKDEYRLPSYEPAAFAKLSGLWAARENQVVAAEEPVGCKLAEFIDHARHKRRVDSQRADSGESCSLQSHSDGQHRH